MLFNGTVATMDDSGKMSNGQTVEYSFSDKDKLKDYLLIHGYVFLGDYDDGMVFNKTLNHWTSKRLTLKQKK